MLNDGTNSPNFSSATRLEFFECLQNRVDVRDSCPIELFRCRVERFVPIVERQFAGGNRRLERLAFFVAFLRIRFAADFLCLVIIEEIQPGLGERNSLERNL